MLSGGIEFLIHRGSSTWKVRGTALMTSRLIKGFILSFWIWIGSNQHYGDEEKLHAVTLFVSH
jgi:hypothetical protein